METSYLVSRTEQARDRQPPAAISWTPSAAPAGRSQALSRSRRSNQPHDQQQQMISNHADGYRARKQQTGEARRRPTDIADDAEAVPRAILPASQPAQADEQMTRMPSLEIRMRNSCRRVVPAHSVAAYR
jgi:hypothetical protein